MGKIGWYLYRTNNGIRPWEGVRKGFHNGLSVNIVNNLILSILNRNIIFYLINYLIIII